MSRISWQGAISCTLFAIPFAIATLVRGEGLPVGGAAPEAATAQTARLLEQLDSPQFSERQSARDSLRDLGLAVFSELERVAVSGSREVSLRALEIFREHLEQGDRELKDAARGVLDRLVSCGSPAAAQRARHILNPPRPDTIMMPSAAPPFPPPPLRGNRFGPPVGLPPVGPPLNGLRRVSMSEINGRRILEIDERERSVRLMSDRAGNIQAEVTEIQNGRNASRTVEVANLDELKRKDGELARLYELYYRPGPGPIGGIGPGGPFGFMPPPLPAPATQNARLQLEGIEKIIEQLKARSPIEPGAQRLIDALEQSKQRFRDMLPPGNAARVER